MKYTRIQGLPFFRGRFTYASVSLCFLLAGVLSAAPAEAGPPNVCRLIPGDQIAKAVGGSLVETKTAEGRCVYIVSISTGKTATGHGFVIYLHPAEDYGGLRDVMEGPLTPIAELGDEAVMNFDRDQKRYWLLAVKHGEVALQVSGDEAELVRKAGDVALRYAAR